MRRFEGVVWPSGHIAGLLAVTYASLSASTSPPGGAIGILQIDQLLHVCAYALLGLTACGWLGFRPAVMRYLGLLALYSGFLELAQTTIPGRSGSWGDFLANAVGLFLSLLIAGAWFRYGARHTITQSQVTKTTQADALVRLVEVSTKQEEADA